MNNASRLVAGALAAMLIALPGFAAPGGGSFPRPSAPRPSPTKPPSPKDAQRESDFDKAEYLIKADKCDEAMPLLQAVVAGNARDADAWNYLGYCSRQLGKFEDALGYYQKALSVDAGHKGAHEYLGELHLKMDNLAKAEGELSTLASLCPSGCEELEDLQQDIVDYKARRPTP